MYTEWDSFFFQLYILALSVSLQGALNSGGKSAAHRVQQRVKYCTHRVLLSRHSLKQCLMTSSRLWPSSPSASSLAVATSVITATAVGCLGGAVAAVVVATLLLLHRRFVISCAWVRYIEYLILCIPLFSLIDIPGCLLARHYAQCVER